MVFIRKVRTASGATAVQIAERVAGRDKVLEHVGSAHSGAGLAGLVAQAEERIRPGQQELPLGFGVESSSKSVIVSKRSALLWHVLSTSFDRLGFDRVGDEAFKQVVLARLIEPASLADTVRILDEIGVEHAGLRTMFRALRRCQDRDYRSQIASAGFAHATAQGDLTLVLYDVTIEALQVLFRGCCERISHAKELSERVSGSGCAPCGGSSWG